jgi:hypothetical protein
MVLSSLLLLVDGMDISTLKYIYLNKSVLMASNVDQRNTPLLIEDLSRYSI